MNKLSGISLLVLAGLMSQAHAQPSPFDMSPESDLRTPEAAPAQSTPDAIVPVEVAPAAFTRYVVPGPSIRLDGEESQAAVVVYLTEAQAAAPARFEFDFLNSLVVAPEISNLRVRINQTEISSSPLAASAAPASRSIEVPSGILRAGANIIEFRASERHRTDCSIASTYELWTEVQGAATRLVFEGQGLSRLSQLTDLPALGLDATGTTRIRLVSNSLSSPDTAEAAIKLAQHLALGLRVPELLIEQADGLSETFEVGVIDVVMMPAADLPDALANVRDQAMSGPVAALTTPASGANTLIVSGPDWAAVSRASEALSPSDAVIAASPRTDLAFPHPLMLGGQSVPLSALSVDTAEFNGRRLTVDFQFELPADFYANRYGELDLVLDAAYSSDVAPGSEIDVYTNGQIASATPLLRTDGGQLRNTVIRIPMTSLRAGRNEGVISVNLQSASDTVCSAGWTGQAPVRFVLSNSSQLRFPDYSRIGQVPDLRVLTGTGWPYTDQASVPLVLGSGEDSVLSAMMLAARIASASGKILPLDVTPASELTPSQNGLVVMPLAEMPSPIVSRSGISPAGTQSGSDSALNRFSGQDTGMPFAAQIDGVLQYFGLQRADLRLFPGSDPIYAAPPNAAVLSQVNQSEGGLWTILTANDTRALRSGTEQLIVTDRWRQVGGRISTIATGDASVTVIPASQTSLVQTQPFSLGNIRLIAANWFSGNILYFAAMIILAAALLTVASSLVLAQLGRRQ